MISHLLELCVDPLWSSLAAFVDLCADDLEDGAVPRGAQLVLVLATHVDVTSDHTCCATCVSCVCLSFKYGLTRKRFYYIIRNLFNYYIPDFSSTHNSTVFIIMSLNNTVFSSFLLRQITAYDLPLVQCGPRVGQVVVVEQGGRVGEGHVVLRVPLHGGAADAVPAGEVAAKALHVVLVRTVVVEYSAKQVAILLQYRERMDAYNRVVVAIGAIY